MPGSDRRLASALPGRLWLIVAISVALRVGAGVYLGDGVTEQPGTADQLSYHLLALRVLGGHGFSFETGWWPATQAGEPTAHWSYLYVLFLAAIYKLAGPAPLVARIVQGIAVGVLQPVLTYAITRRLFGARVALTSAAVVAGYAYFIYYAGALMTESFFIVALLWSIQATLRLAGTGEPDARRESGCSWAILGAALAATILLRQAFLVCVPVIFLWVGWRRLAPGGGAPAKSAAALRGLTRGFSTTALVMAIAILPWTARNYRVFHEFVLLNTNAGFAFFWGNHPVHGTHFIPIFPGNGSRYGELIPDDVRGLNEAEMDRALLRRGVDFVIDDPVRYGWLSVSRIREFVKFWPSPDSGRLSNLSRMASFGVCAPFMLAGLALLLGDRSCRSSCIDGGLVLGVALVYSLAHVLTWTLVRYRLPVDALLLPLAALSMQRGFERLVLRIKPVRSDVLVAG